jgi:hypothetical protein
MAGSHIELEEIDLPEFGLPAEEPAVPAATFEARRAAARQRAANDEYDALIVYGDREHFANLTYLTNYDPRFEEALLILVPGRKPTLLVGNEGRAYASAVVRGDVELVLYQPFSLISQPRDASRPLGQILLDAGLGPGQRVGAAGWKYYTEQETARPLQWLEIPAFLVDTLRGLGCVVENAADLFMNPETGLRAVNDADQLAVFEFAATWSSQGVRNILFGVRPGMSEYEVMQLARLNGLPTNLHPVFLSGERTRLSLAGPSSRRIVRGDPVVVALGLWGSNTCRAGFLAEGPGDLPAEIADYVPKLVVPYFQAALAWYDTVGIGVTGGELYDAVHRHVGDEFFGVTLNPGHLIHLDEWVSSPIYENSAERLRSGMALQVDIIPATGTPWFTSNIEDGVALADEALRAEIAGKYPEMWGRIQQRRAFLKDAVGIELKPEVLPFSNIPGYLPPFWLSPRRVLRRV